ncbi:MAG: hypothetical protein M5U25_16230 [Planctomycetota bacterium]|nr:hypothetical protein [Planctomycetota bacterium]
MAVRCQTGQGVPKDEVECLRWTRLSAEGGDSDGQVTLGRCYEVGQYVEKDEQEALRWYRRAAAQNDQPHAAKLLADLEARLRAKEE